MGIGPYSGYSASFPQVSAACDGLVGVFLNQNVLKMNMRGEADVTSQNESSCIPSVLDNENVVTCSIQ